MSKYSVNPMLNASILLPEDILSSFHSRFLLTSEQIAALQALAGENVPFQIFAKLVATFKPRHEIEHDPKALLRYVGERNLVDQIPETRGHRRLFTKRFEKMMAKENLEMKEVMVFISALAGKALRCFADQGLPREVRERCRAIVVVMQNDVILHEFLPQNLSLRLDHTNARRVRVIEKRRTPQKGARKQRMAPCEKRMSGSELVRQWRENTGRGGRGGFAFAY